MSAGVARVPQDPASSIAPTDPSHAERWFATVGEGLRTRRLAPYLGPELLRLDLGAAIPRSHPELAAFFASKVGLPKRARGNPWSAAQYIESNKHRATLTNLMKAAFAEQRPPLPFFQALARWAPPLVVDTWYDSMVRDALGAGDWIEFQGNTRAGIGEHRWFRAYGPDGGERPAEDAPAAATVLYKPHGGIRPAGNFLVSDSDYVEVLTEIDIQTPIPQAVRERRGSLGFVFLGCRFDDQMLRIFARQILKRSRGPHFAIFPQDDLTRMERRFVAELQIDVLVCPLAQAIDRLMAEDAR